MKRNSTAKKILSVLLAVLVISTCFAYLPFEALATTGTTCEVGFPRSGDPSYSYSGFGTLGGTCVSGNTYNPSRANTLFFLNGSYSKLAFCIELGQPVQQWDTIETTEESAACDILAERLLTSANAEKVAMSGDRMQSLLRSVLGYGYQHDGTDMSQWHDIVNNAYQRENYSYAYATQLLVWELVSGERDANFNYISVPAGYISVYDHSIKYDSAYPDDPYKTNPLKTTIDKYYRQIEADVKNATPNIDSSITDTIFTLQANEATKTMEVTIPDVNGLFKNTTSIPGLEGAVVTHTGAALYISVSYRYAKEGTYQLNYTIKSKIPGEVEIYLPANTQDMVAAVGGVTEVNTTGSLSLVIPHHHEWVPHMIVPTCTTEGLTCMMCKCGNIYTESTTAALDHDYTNSAWVVGHPATCTEDGELVQICERCNTVIGSEVIPKTGHNGVWVIKSEPSAEHDGQMVLYCTKCGNKTETKTYEKHTHEFGYEAVVRDATCATEGMMGTFCKHCGVCYDTATIAAGHSESVTWVTTIQPTCTEAGECSAFCDDCGDIVATKPIEATEHASGIWKTSIAPFCGLTGEEICICDRCGETIDSRETEALSHDEGVWKTTKDPTCEFVGERAKSCTRCGQIIETETIDALGHDVGVWKIDFEATADHDGQMGRYCTRCSMVLETTTFTLHFHEEGYTAILLQPTCTRDGEMGAVCSICNAVFSTETISALNHDYSEFYTESNGTHSKSCSRCHYVYTENCNYEITESHEATCTTAGFRISKCIVCAYTCKDSFVPPYGHTFDKWISEGKSTHMRSCTECGVMEISKHVWGEYFSNNDGDFIEEGSKTRSCIYCSEEQTVGKPADIILTVLNTTIRILEFLAKLFSTLNEFSDIFSRLSALIKVLKIITLF